MTDFDAREVYALASDLGDVPADMIAATRDVIRDGANELRDQWKAYARETSGQHARLYPGSIHATTFYTTAGIEAEIGPVLSAKQGFLGPVLEFGGTHSPPHRNGQRAADEIIPRIERRMMLAAEDVFDA